MQTSPDAPAAAAETQPGLNELFLIKLRYKVGRLVEVGGNKPLLLNERDTVWVVYSGNVDVFAVQVADGQPVGPRTHLFRAGVGRALFGAAGSEAGAFGLLAVGTAGTQLLKIQQPRLRALVTGTDVPHEVIEILDNWVLDLSAALGLDMPPQEYVPAEAGKTVELSAGQITRPKDGVVWARLLAGELHPLGRPELALAPGPVLVPMHKRLWFQAPAGAALACVDTPGFTGEDAQRFALDAFHQLVMAGIGEHARQEEVAERERLAARIAADRRHLQRAVAELAAALEPSAAPPAEAAAGEVDALLAACRVAGDAMGVRVQAPPQLIARRGVMDAIAAIARASRMRVRRVTLQGAWWRAGAGPLLAFTRAGRHPVALLPGKAGGYLLHDPQQAGLPQWLSTALAATLDADAYAFYRPFPDKALTGRDLVRFGLRGSARDLLAVLGLGVLGGMLGTIVPLATGMIFDSVIPGADYGLLTQVALGLLMAAAATALFQVTRSIALLRVEGRMDAEIQAAVWDRLLSLPVPFFQNYSAGDLAARAMGINTIRQTMSGMVISSVLSIVFSLFNFVLLFIIDTQLALVATVLVLIAGGAMALASYWQMRTQRALANLQGHLSGMVVQFVAGIAKLRVAGVEGRAFAFWARDFSRQKRLAYEARTVDNALSVFNSAYPILTFIAIFGAYAFVSSARLSTGQFLAFNAAFAQFLAATISVSGAWLAIIGIVPIYERAKPILATLPEVDQAKLDPGDLAGGIEVNHVAYRYTEKGPLVLDDVSLQINPGEFVALVGASGSGKSTLFRLLLAFDAPQSGAIYYDGKDLGRLDVRAVRRQIGVVLQHGRLMPGDIYTNIVGNSGLGLEAAWEAARMVGLAEDIERMPMGMHTMIGEGGGTLSGGQKQRLLIARAIVTRPRVIFFDEATSALDNRTQDIVSQSLERLEATRVVIAHRLSTILHADRIFVMEKGRLVQSGTYEELVNQRGPFATLAKRQLA